MRDVSRRRNRTIAREIGSQRDWRLTPRVKFGRSTIPIAICADTALPFDPRSPSFVRIPFWNGRLLTESTKRTATPLMTDMFALRQLQFVRNVTTREAEADYFHSSSGPPSIRRTAGGRDPISPPNRPFSRAFSIAWHRQRYSHRSAARSEFSERPVSGRTKARRSLKCKCKFCFFFFYN